MQIVNQIESILQDYEIERFKESRTFKSLSLIRGKILHATSLKGLNGIVETGEIRPNTGDFGPTWGQSKDSYGGTNHYISLFDFVSVSDEDLAIALDGIESCLFSHRPLTFWLVIDQSGIREKIIPNEDGMASNQLAIPYV